MEYHVDIYRLIKLCGLLVTLWVVQVIAIGKFQSGISTEPPNHRVMDTASGEDFTNPDFVVEVFRARRSEPDLQFVSADRAGELDHAHKLALLKAWGCLALAMIAFSAMVYLGHRLWDSWLLGIAAALLGPFWIAVGMHASNTGSSRSAVLSLTSGYARKHFVVLINGFGSL